MMATRLELYMALGLVRIADPIIEQIYVEHEERIWRQDLDSSPHGAPWHTSFHASQFPGDDERACPRLALYRLMNLPAPEPTSRWLRALGDAGKDHELQIVRRLQDAGRLLSAGPDEPLQTGFVDREHWLTASTDAIILPPFWRRPFVYEIKGKGAAKIDEMQAGQRRYDPQHRNQVLTTIAMARVSNPWPTVTVCQHTWKLPRSEGGIVVCREHGGWSCLIEIELEPIQDGCIYYFSRDTPSNTFEFYFTYDPDFIKSGIEKIRDWKEFFLQDELPPRPEGWTWTSPPCQYCDFKKHACKPDHKAKINKLSESKGIEFAQQVRPDYLFDEACQTVIDRWKEEAEEQRAAA